VPDANCEGHFRVLLRLLHSQRRRELWHFLNLAVLTFDELGLPSDASDRHFPWPRHQTLGSVAELSLARRRAEAWKMADPDGTGARVVRELLA